MKKKTIENNAIVGAVEGISHIIGDSRQVNAKIETYDQTILDYNDQQFKIMFRMSRASFEKLLRCVQSHNCFIQTQTGGKEAIKGKNKQDIYCCFSLSVHELQGNSLMTSFFFFSGRPMVPVEKQVQLCLWFCASRENYIRIGDRFGMHQSTAMKCVDRVVKAILENLLPNVICWPSVADQKKNQGSIFT